MRRVVASGELDRPIREEEDGCLEAGSEGARRCRDEVALQPRECGGASCWNLVVETHDGGARLAMEWVSQAMGWRKSPGTVVFRSAYLHM